ncbi:MAG: hypothetical protein EU530_00780 [Promethearchaeota archaeon]|nr:MAG: hypothetical protein EU530_00780 [Candidatus Lokiarchaeota archaeon]
MALNIWAILIGASETILVLLGFFYFFKFFNDYTKYKKKLTPFLAFLALSLGSMHLGGSVAFFMKLIANQDITYITYGFLTYIPLPIGLTLAVFIGSDVFQPKLKWIMASVHAALGITLLVALIGWPEIQMEELPATTETLVDANVQHIVGTIFTAYLISTVLALGFNFLQISSKMNQSEITMKKKSLVLGIGWILWALGEFFAKGQFDFIPVELAILPNTIIFTALIMIFLGFAPLKED